MQTRLGGALAVSVYVYLVMKGQSRLAVLLLGLSVASLIFATFKTRPKS